MRDFLANLGGAIDERTDALRQRFAARFDNDRAVYIQPYRWFGSAEALTIRGRVLRHNGLRPAAADDSNWDNLINSYRRFESDEVAFAPLSASFFGQTWQLKADAEGYFDAVLELAQPVTAGWHEVAVKPVGYEQYERAVVPVLVVAKQAVLGIISDIDDTILQTHATNLIEVAKLTLLGNANIRLPFTGVAAFYQALQRGADGQQHNPFFYVSSSPWNLYDLLTDFMEVQNIPAGPLCLRDLGIDRDKLITSGHGDHKLEQIKRILDAHPELPFILVGDSGQHDPEIYQQVAALYPGRIQTVYVRDVADEKRDADVAAIAKLMRNANVDMLLMADSYVASAHAMGRGWINQHDLAAVADAVRGNQQTA